MLLGPSFTGKAVEHLTQLKTLRQARGTTKSNQDFPRPPHTTVSEGANPRGSKAANHTQKEETAKGVKP